MFIGTVVAAVVVVGAIVVVVDMVFPKREPSSMGWLIFVCLKGFVSILGRMLSAPPQLAQLRGLFTIFLQVVISAFHAFRVCVIHVTGVVE